MSDGEVTRLVPLTLEASEQRVTESSLEEPTTGMGIQAGKAPSSQPMNISAARQAAMTAARFMSGRSSIFRFTPMRGAYIGPVTLM